MAATKPKRLTADPATDSAPAADVEVGLEPLPVPEAWLPAVPLVPEAPPFPEPEPEPLPLPDPEPEPDPPVACAGVPVGV
jgi:hypothetical protein